VLFGASLGPGVFSPLLTGRELDGDALATLWLAAGGFMAAGLALVCCERPDPTKIRASRLSASWLTARAARCRGAA
jgi:hypothetical protein